MLGELTHCLGSFLPICLHHVLIRRSGVQYTDDGGKHQKGVSAEVDGEEVLCRGQTSGVRLKMVCVRRHLDEGVDCITFLLSRRNR